MVYNEIIWDIIKNKKIENYTPDEILNNKNFDIKNFCKCSISKDNNINILLIEPLDPDDTILNDANVIQIIDKVKSFYPKINNFLVKYNERKESMFYKTYFGKIKSVDKSEKNKNSFDKQKKANDKKTKNLIQKVQDTLNIPRKFNKESFSNWFLKEFSFDENEYKNIPEIKTNIDDMDMDEYNDFIQNNMEDIDKSFIEYELSSDTNKKTKIGSLINRQGMGDLYTIQSIINDGNLRTSRDAFDTIITRLEEIEEENKKKKKKYLADMCQVYKDFLNYWKAGKGSQSIINSDGYRKAMTSYFPEIISPFVFLYSNKNTNCITDDAPIKLLKEKIGTENLEKENPYISYPQSTTQMLFDSVLCFSANKKASKFKCLRISVKGGKNGLGAKASIAGLKSYFYEKENVNIPSNLFSSKRFFDCTLYSQYYRPYIKKFAMQSPENSMALKILSALMLATKSNGYDGIIEEIHSMINKGKIKNKKISQKYSEVQFYLNTHPEFENCVLAALQYASYDFAQLNCIEIPKGEGPFHYNYSIQYPAIFKGKIEFELIQGNEPHKLTFHIIGE